MNPCKICGNAVGNKTHVAREMMFGLRHQFSYLECGQCGCLQLLSIPADLSQYYPKNYYSFQRHGWLMTAVRHRWSAYAFGRRSLLGWFLAGFYFPNQALMAVRRLELPPGSKILDIGCGAGHLLLDLKYLGFHELTGVDSFLEKDIAYPGGPTVYRKQLAEMQGEYDLIMLHHCFEHMDQPQETLRTIARLLGPGGRVIIRIPVASSYGWKHYGINWVHLDAPRHLFLHTDKSVRLLAQGANLCVVDAVQEGDDGSFWASESYAKDISMYDPRFPTSTALKKVLTWRQTLRFRARARELNSRGEGDAVCFYLSRKPDAAS